MVRLQLRLGFVQGDTLTFGTDRSKVSLSPLALFIHTAHIYWGPTKYSTALLEGDTQGWDKNQRPYSFIHYKNIPALLVYCGGRQSTAASVVCPAALVTSHYKTQIFRG